MTKEIVAYQIVHTGTGERVNSKANHIKQVLFHPHGRFFTEGAAKTFKNNVLKASTKEFGGIEFTPDNVIKEIVRFLQPLQIVKVKTTVMCTEEFIAYPSCITNIINNYS